VYLDVLYQASSARIDRRCKHECWVAEVGTRSARSRTYGKILPAELASFCFELPNRALAMNEPTRRLEAKFQAEGARRERWKFLVESVLGPSSFTRSEAFLTASANGLEIDVVSLDSLVPRGQCVDLVKVAVEQRAASKGSQASSPTSQSS
jgi:hypothetical protein